MLAGVVGQRGGFRHEVKRVQEKERGIKEREKEGGR